MVNECSSIIAGGALATSGAETTVSDDRVEASYKAGKVAKEKSDFSVTTLETSSTNSKASYCSGSKGFLKDSTRLRRFDYILFYYNSYLF